MKKNLILMVAAAVLLCGCNFSRNQSGTKDVPAEPADETEFYGDDEFYDDYTWEAVDLDSWISLLYDRTEYGCEVVHESATEKVFRLTPAWEDAGEAFARIRFEIADRVLDTGSDAWEEALQDALDPLMDELEEDDDFMLDGRFSPWQNLASDYGLYIRYMGTRLADDRYVEGAFAAKGNGKGRALMQAEATEEETLTTLLDLFDTVEFDF
ncbi:MAG: hypothetical protein K5910_09410 [Bacteroidales bacterium]|nr:hypothetical protein [Bacteroidales bacterium]